MGFANLDTDRNRRRGFPEVIYAPGKSDRQLQVLAKNIILSRQTLLITRLKEESFVFLKESFPELRYNPQARIAYLRLKNPPPPKGLAVVVSAGTSDIPVAEEASCVLEIMGNKVKRLYDLGVAGVHRLMDKRHILRRAKVIVVAAATPRS